MVPQDFLASASLGDLKMDAEGIQPDPWRIWLLAQIPLKLIGMAVPSAFLFHYPELRWNHPLHPCFTPPMRFRHVETVSYDRRLEAPGREYNRVLDAYLNGMISDAESEQRLLEPPNASASKQNSPLRRSH